jgi:hypothetical protein
VKFAPSELELLVMRALDRNPWHPPASIAEIAGIPTETALVRSTLSELRRFHLVVSDGRLGGGRAGRYCLTDAGEAVLIDSVRCRALELAAA